jgi:hypothetical protein
MNNVYVLAIGIAHYTSPEIENIENIKKNIEDFVKVLKEKYLKDSFVINITSILDEDSSVVLKAIEDEANKCINAESTLLIYYAGHGIVNPSTLKLQLATKNTNEESLESSSISGDQLMLILGKCIAPRKVLIVDCCYSGKMIVGQMGSGSPRLIIDEELLKISGTYLLTSSDEIGKSFYDHLNPETPTYFTNELINVIYFGVHNNRPSISFRDIYQEVKANLVQKKIKQTPHQSNFNDGADISLFRNKMYNEELAEKQIWDNALAINSKEEYIQYIKYFPNGGHRSIAQLKIESCREEEEWLNCISTGGELLFKNFILEYPNSIHKSEAEWNLLLTCKTVEQYEKFISEHSRSIHIESAIKKRDAQIETDFFIELKTENSISGFRKYLNKYPEGSYVSTVMSLIKKKERKLQVVFVSVIIVAFSFFLIYQLNYRWLNKINESVIDAQSKIPNNIGFQTLIFDNLNSKAHVVVCNFPKKCNESIFNSCAKGVLRAQSFFNNNVLTDKKFYISFNDSTYTSPYDLVQYSGQNRIESSFIIENPLSLRYLPFYHGATSRIFISPICNQPDVFCSEIQKMPNTKLLYRYNLNTEYSALGSILNRFANGFNRIKYFSSNDYESQKINSYMTSNEVYQRKFTLVKLFSTFSYESLESQILQDLPHSSIVIFDRINQPYIETVIRKLQKANNIVIFICNDLLINFLNKQDLRKLKDCYLLLDKNHVGFINQYAENSFCSVTPIENDYFEYTFILLNAISKVGDDPKKVYDYITNFNENERFLGFSNKIKISKSGQMLIDYGVYKIDSKGLVIEIDDN